MMTSRITRVVAVVLAQAALVVVAVWAPLSARATGQEVVLRVAAYDPIDPFRGAYVQLGYPDLPGNPTPGLAPAETPEAPVEEQTQDLTGPAYVPLVQKGEVWVGSPITRTRPSSGLYLTCDDSQWRLRCGIETFFLPQGSALALEKAVADGDALATVKVDGRGHAALVDVTVAN